MYPSSGGSGRRRVAAAAMAALLLTACGSGTEPDASTSPTASNDADAHGSSTTPAAGPGDHDTEPDLARLEDPQTPRDELPVTEDGVTPIGSGLLDPATSRWLGDGGDRLYFAARDRGGDVCLAVVLPGKTSGLSCLPAADFHTSGVWVRVSAQGASAEAWLVPDAVADGSNIVEIGDDGPEPPLSLDPEGVEATDFRIPPQYAEE
ncbi:MAG: hypothetical protein ACTMKU_06775 [Actinomycetaceae bacterium]